MIQTQALNYILESKDSSFITSNSLTKDYFSEYVSEFEFIKSHIELYNNVPDIETFLNQFPDFDYIKVNENPEYLLSGLQEDRNKRYLAEVFNKIRNLLMEGKTDEALKLYSSSQTQNFNSISLKAVDIYSDISRYESYATKSTDFSKFYVTTGFREIDKVLGGWDRLEELGVIFARSNQGKSWCLLKCAVAAAKQGLRVGVYSGEMTATKVAYRIDTLNSHISNSKLLHGDLSVQNDYKRYLDGESKNLKDKLYILTPNDCGGPAGVSKLRSFIEKYKLDMLCIDQHSLLEDDRNARNPVEKASNISKDLKNLQVMMKIPIIAVSQQNREKAEAGEPKVSLTNISQSDRIGQDATTVLALDQVDGVMTIYLIKSRDSVNGKQFRYAIDIDHGIFNYIPTDENCEDVSKCDELREEFDGEEESPF